MGRTKKYFDPVYLIKFLATPCGDPQSEVKVSMKAELKAPKLTGIG